MPENSSNGYSIRQIPSYGNEVKRLVKKYPSLKGELSVLYEQLTENPETGTPIGHNCFKIRLAIASKGKGKSGGARIITHTVVVNETVYLLSIYDKSEQSAITNTELDQLLALIQ
jgi:hypothetical protein